MKQHILYLLLATALLTYATGCKEDTPSNPNSVTNNSPTVPVNPYPADSSTGIKDSTDLMLSWECTDPDLNDTLKFDLYAGTSLPLSTVPLAANLISANYILMFPIPGATYYWQVKARDNHGASSTGSIWQFTIKN